MEESQTACSCGTATMWQFQVILMIVGLSFEDVRVALNDYLIWLILDHWWHSLVYHDDINSNDQWSWLSWIRTGDSSWWHGSTRGQMCWTGLVCHCLFYIENWYVGAYMLVCLVSDQLSSKRTGRSKGGSSLERSWHRFFPSPFLLFHLSVVVFYLLFCHLGPPLIWPQPIAVTTVINMLRSDRRRREFVYQIKPPSHNIWYSSNWIACRQSRGFSDFDQNHQTENISMSGGENEWILCSASSSSPPLPPTEKHR